MHEGDVWGYSIASAGLAFSHLALINAISESFGTRLAMETGCRVNEVDVINQFLGPAHLSWQDVDSESALK